jgi:ubiquitin-protein ligase E3 C
MNLLAGYLLTLLRCFPDNSDEIRMLIYQCDLPTVDGMQPIVGNFWELTKQTSIYREALRVDRASTRLLQSYLSGTADQGDRSDSEWRVILLFLELYNFTLRVAGDDDFRAGIQPGPLLTPAKQNRLQSCCLSLAAVSGLSVFLKRLSFAIYHDASAISPPKRPRARSSLSLSSAGTPIEATTRLDLDGLKSIIPTTMQLIYEKDSRLRFLPADHWLMTSRFKMDNFIHDVVLEWQRRQEADAEASDEEQEEDMPLYVGLIQTQRGADLIRRRRSEWTRKMREQRLASIGPTIEILQHMPFTIPFETRAKIFKEFVQMDQFKRRGGSLEPDIWRHALPSPQAQRQIGRIKRGSSFEDAYNSFYPLNDGLKEPVFITFLDRFGVEEAGIDGGGVTKEFLTSAITEAFDDGQPWFTRNSQGLYYPNPGINSWHREMITRPGMEEIKTSQREALKKLEFLGRLVGKCLYEGILIDVNFAGFFLMRWRTGGDKDYKCTINDLRDVDEDLYKGLISLKNEVGNVSDWDLYWTIDDEVWFGDDREKFHVTRNLVPGGDTIKVTNENRLAFIAAVVKHRLVTQPAAEMRAFVSGLQTMIDPSWLSMFNQAELQRLVGGDSNEIDLEDLKQNTVYSGLYVVGDDGVLHPTIDIFWRVMEGFTDSQRRDVIKFVTSTPRAPLLGFSQLNPRFAIRDSGGAGGADEGLMRLPSASTCINLLKLPLYKTVETMRQKLLQAISAGAGFDLS